MSKRKDALIRDLEALIEPVCLAHRVELVEVRHIPQKSSAIIRITIDRERQDGKEGSDITLEDCTAVSRDVSEALDVNNAEGELLGGAFHLEVSSPGLERPLVRPKDFVRFAGREIKLRTHEPIVFEGDKRGSRRKFQGELVGLRGADSVRATEEARADESIPLELEGLINEDEDDLFVELSVEGRSVCVPLPAIAQANLVYRF